MKAGPVAIELTVAEDRFTHKAFPDEKQRMAIGHGHVLLSKENINLPLSKEKALDLLIHDFVKLERTVLAHIKNIAQHQFDAIACWAYHASQGRCNTQFSSFGDSAMLKLLMAEDYANVATEFDNWVYVDSRFSRRCALRRNREKYLFLYGTLPQTT